LCASRAGLVCAVLGAAGMLCALGGCTADTRAPAADEASATAANDGPNSAAAQPPKSATGKVASRAASGGPTYTASAFLRVAKEQPYVVFEPTHRDSIAESNIYKQNQAELLKSRFVLTSALRRREVREFNLAQRYADPVGWLADNLRVEFPQDAEIMKVSLTTHDRSESQALLDAAVEAYMTLIVGGEEKRRRSDRLNQLDRIYEEKETAVRDKRTEVKRLAEVLGISDAKGGSFRQQAAVEQFFDSQKELLRLQNDMRRAKGELSVREALLAGAADAEISEIELDSFAQSDPTISQVLLPQLAQVRKQLLEAQGTGKTPADAQQAARLQRQLQDTQAQLDVRRGELRKKLREGKAASIRAEIKNLEIQIAVGADMMKQLEAQMDKQRIQAERLSGSSIDLEMLRTQVQQLEEVLRSIAWEREKLKLEVHAEPRVTVIQPADAPQSPD